MHIKKLEISGFKSFVDKSVIHFDHDVIGIVGPNGCGKSNIVDAIRWCMGEQSAKHLRGRAMEDVIFNGSESRPPHGMAEVTLTFDNSDPVYADALPLEYKDFPEIAVTRRLFRDGTSEYLINKTQVRLRDVTDLFLGTGVGTKAYSIVEQGRIGQIVSSRPQDRRLFIEEAAGITKYKLRRKQAEKKMDLTRQNLLRITDIVSEIDRNRGSLKRQAAKAERYIEYRNELEDLYLHDASHRLLEMIVVRNAAANALRELSDSHTEIFAQLESGEDTLLKARSEATSIEQHYDGASTLTTELERRATQLSSDCQRYTDRLSHLDARSQSLGAELATLGEKQQHWVTERAELEERLTHLQTDEASSGSDAAFEDEQLQSLAASAHEAEQELTTLRNQHATLATEAATQSGRLESTQLRDRELLERRGLLLAERDELVAEVERLTAKANASTAELEILRAHREQSAQEQAASLARLNELKPQKVDLTRRTHEVRNEVQLKRNRLKVLQDLHRRLEGVGAGTKALLSFADPAVVGILADRLEVSPRFTDALAGLLGERLQCVIVSDPVRGLELLDQLKRQQRGRATIAIQSNLRETPAPAVIPADEPTVIGRLLDEVLYEDADAGLVQALLGNVVVTETPQAALDLNGRFPGSKIVSLDGTVVSGTGLVAGGSGDEVNTAIVEQKREVRELTEALTHLDAELARLVAEEAEVATELAAVETQVEAGRKSHHERELLLLTAEKDHSRSVAELERVTRRDGVVAADLEKLEQSSEGSTSTLAQIQTRLEELQREQLLCGEALAKALDYNAEAKTQHAAQAARVTERKIRLAQVREQLEASRSGLMRVSAELTAAAQRRTELDSELQNLGNQSGVTSAELLTARAEADHTTAERDQARVNLDEVRRLLDEVRSGLSGRETALREMRNQLTDLEERSREFQMKVQRLDLEREHLVQGVRERFRGLELPRVVGDYHARPAPDAEHRRRIDELSKLIDRMGPVNLDAQAEYEDAERRFTELNDQKVDIETALAELDRAIKHMDRESKKRFKETFDIINDLFKQTFMRLFKGGRGELKLTEPDNLLETGVDIIAQPPGKKLGNIELMSGGEKALTATALIFAIFQHKPSPFCVLDEVDAPLDEANVSRYNEAIRAMTSHSQFVIITHIKKTMQSVDVLYGVTMGEPGVSRLVSVKVNETAVSRSDRSPSALPKRREQAAAAAASEAVAESAPAVA
jgi:chromosome segregation protein